MFKEFDVVGLKHATTEIPLPKGTKGTVLMIHPDNPPAYQVEFMDGPKSLGVFTVREPDLDLLAPFVESLWK